MVHQRNGLRLRILELTASSVAKRGFTLNSSPFRATVSSAKVCFMKAPIRRFLCLASVGTISVLLGGCLLGVRTADVMVLPTVGQYQRLAVVGLEPESEQVFKEVFRETFPEMEFAARQEVLEVFPEEDVHTGRLERDVGERLHASLGVQALLSVLWEDSGMGGTLDWLMTITDTETGQTSGTVTVEAAVAIPGTKIARSIATAASFTIFNTFFIVNLQSFAGTFLIRDV